MARVYFESLGCDKNLVDSEVMLGLLRKEGYDFTDDEREAELIIVNTCAFIGDAKKESIDTILRLAACKEGRCRALIVTGCLAERYKDEILKELPEIDAVLGTASYDHICEVADRVMQAGPEAETPSVFEDKSRQVPAGLPRILTGGGYYAFLKIAEGCDKYCSYCAIPFVRGHYRSVPLEALRSEAAQLAAKGVRELILVAQETTLYGTDLYGRKALPELIRSLAAVPGIAWIRLLYGYPEELTEELIDVMAEEPKFCHYLDLPIQHASDAVLKRMGRRTSQAELRERIARLRERIPDIALRTTLMTGFPGETEEDHAENLRFVQEMRFDRLGCFAYSREEGTAAYRMPGQVPQRVKEKRRREIMQAQQRIAFETAQEMKGRELTVLVEGQLAGEGTYVARTYRDAPEVDGLLFFDSPAVWLSGDLVKVRVTGARGYDLYGEVCDEPSE